MVAEIISFLDRAPMKKLLMACSALHGITKARECGLEAVG